MEEIWQKQIKLKTKEKLSLKRFLRCNESTSIQKIREDLEMLKISLYIYIYNLLYFLLAHFWLWTEVDALRNLSFTVIFPYLDHQDISCTIMVSAVFILHNHPLISSLIGIQTLAYAPCPMPTCPLNMDIYLYDALMSMYLTIKIKLLVWQMHFKNDCW